MGPNGPMPGGPGMQNGPPGSGMMGGPNMGMGGNGNPGGPMHSPMPPCSTPSGAGGMTPISQGPGSGSPHGSNHGSGPGTPVGPNSAGNSGNMPNSGNFKAILISELCLSSSNCFRKHDWHGTKLKSKQQQSKLWPTKYRRSWISWSTQHSNGTIFSSWRSWLSSNGTLFSSNGSWWSSHVRSALNVQ